MKTFGLSEKDAENLLNQVVIFVNGISAFTITDADSFSKEAVSRGLSEPCIGIVLTDKLRDGTIGMVIAKKMADSCESGIMPHKK